jgi:DNA-binding NtrC family response regulator
MEEANSGMNHNENILIVDADSSIRHLLSTVLAANNYSVLTANPVLSIVGFNNMLS